MVDVIKFGNSNIGIGQSKFQTIRNRIKHKQRWQKRILVKKGGTMKDVMQVLIVMNENERQMNGKINENMRQIIT